MGLDLARQFHSQLALTLYCSISVCPDSSMIPSGGGEEVGQSRAGVGVTNAIPALRPVAKLPHCNVAHCLASTLCLFVSPLSLSLSLIFGGTVLWPLYGLVKATSYDAPAATQVPYALRPLNPALRVVVLRQCCPFCVVLLLVQEFAFNFLMTRLEAGERGRRG